MIQQFLRGVPLFRELDDDELTHVLMVGLVRRHSQGSVILAEGAAGGQLQIIHSGRVRISKFVPGVGEEALTILTPGDFFGELSVLDGQPRIAQVIADESTVCLALASWDFEAVVKEQPAVALAILRGLAGRLRELTEAHRH